MSNLPSWLDPEPWLAFAGNTNASEVKAAICSTFPGVSEFATLITPGASEFLETMAQQAQAITRCHFGRTISLYVPLYLSNYCPGGCVYCGFASDRQQHRRKLEKDDLFAELNALKERGFEDILLLTGERTDEANFDYLLDCVSIASKVFHNITIESFSMSTEEYQKLSDAGCTGITLYQETYDPVLYEELHRWGPKRNYAFRLEAPARALEAGMRTVGVGVLLGLGDPVYDAICLFQHIQRLRKQFWQAGISVSFPRVCAQQGGYQPQHPVEDRFLAQMVFAFRICLPDVPLVLSTREKQEFRDNIAGIGISRMSVASRTTVGGYAGASASGIGQFDVSDDRDVETFCEALRKKGLEPVFKNWDSVFNAQHSISSYHE